MKIVFLSDVHGVASALKVALSAAESLGYDRLVLLGDLLHHGPGDGPSRLYDSAEVARVLNGLKGRIMAVRGNCDMESDQGMFDFPMMGYYEVLDAGKETFFLTHGHRWNEYSLPPLGMGSVLVHGHTHIPESKCLECGLRVFNPGSVAFPRGGSSRSFGYFDGETFSLISI